LSFTINNGLGKVAFIKQSKQLNLKIKMAKQPTKKTARKTTKTSVVKKTAAKKVTAKKAVAKKTVAKKAVTKKAAVKKTAAKKAVAKKTTRKAPAKKDPIITTVIAKVDAGFGNEITIRGNSSGLTWDSGALMENIGSDEWVWKSSAVTSELEFKVLLNDEVWSTGPNGVVFPGATVVFEPSF
jgi:ATPase subunit of ABC transporter with duplicated ATPase domains